jgi:quercetin 2,3-dioxygenase
MITIRRSSERGYADRGWLQSFHTFSFGDYFDPKFLGFGNLLVINEDYVAPTRGFATHSHNDMEIVSYVIEGELAHKDSMGNGTPGATQAGVIRPGDVQRMSAGTGVQHSEFNRLEDRTTHFLQIWLRPDQLDIPPSYEQKTFETASKRGRLCLVASSDGRHGSVTLHASASIHAGLFEANERATFSLAPERLGYVQVVRGEIKVGGQRLVAGDGAKIFDERHVLLSDGIDAEVLVFDLSL